MLVIFGIYYSKVEYTLIQFAFFYRNPVALRTSKKCVLIHCFVIRFLHFLLIWLRSSSTSSVSPWFVVVQRVLLGFLLKRKIANYFWLSFRSVGGNEPCFRRCCAVRGKNFIFTLLGCGCSALLLLTLLYVVRFPPIQEIISPVRFVFAFLAHHWSAFSRRGASLTSQGDTEMYRLHQFNTLVHEYCLYKCICI